MRPCVSGRHVTTDLFVADIDKQWTAHVSRSEEVVEVSTDLRCKECSHDPRARTPSTGCKIQTSNLSGFNYADAPLRGPDVQ